MRGLSPEQRKRIVHKWGTVSGLSIRKLAREEGISVGAVQTSLRKYCEECTFTDALRRGRKPGPVDRTMDKKVKEYYKRHPSVSL